MLENSFVYANETDKSPIANSRDVWFAKHDIAINSEEFTCLALSTTEEIIIIRSIII